MESQTTTISTGQQYYPQQLIQMAMNQRAIIQQLQLDFLYETKNQQPTSPRRKFSNPNLGGSLCETHLAIGAIVFIQPKIPGTKNCMCVLPDCPRRPLGDRGYNHPAVVLDILDHRQNGELTALCCTISANPQPNQREKPSSFNITQIPKGDSETPTTAPNGATVLYLEPESTMYKKSHIIDSHVYAIPVSQLTNFLCNKPLQNRLTKESYEALIANFKSITPRKWTKTAKLVVGERDPAPVTPPLRTATISTIPKPTPAVAPAPTLVAIPIEIQQIIIALLQFLTKEQLFEQAPELLAEYPQLLTVLA